MHNIPPPALSDELWKLWLHHAAELYKRDGNQDFPHGGHDIVNNTQLRSTLEDLAHIYLPMCVEKFALLNEQISLNDTLMSNEEYDYQQISDRLDALKTLIEGFDEKLLQTNASSIRKLLKEDSGLDEEARREALSSPKERRNLALTLLAPVIKYSVQSACEYSGYNAQLATHPTLIKSLKGFVPRSVGASRHLS